MFYYCGRDDQRNNVGIVLDNLLKESVVVDVKRVSDGMVAVIVNVDSVVVNICVVFGLQSWFKKKCQAQDAFVHTNRMLRIFLLRSEATRQTGSCVLLLQDAYMSIVNDTRELVKRKSTCCFALECSK